MKVTCNTLLLAKSINDDADREEFLKKHNPEKQPFIEMKTYERWTSEQQGKIWRDLCLYGKEIFECSGEYVYQNILQGDRCPFKNLFVTKESIKIKGKIREDTTKKGLSKFSKSDCIKLLEVMPDYLEKLACTLHQRVIKFNWSCRESKKNNLPFSEFTKIPFDITKEVNPHNEILNEVLDEFDGVIVKNET